MALIEMDFAGGGKDLVETLLWTNPSPSSAIGSTDITLPDISQFDYLKFVYKAHTTDTNIYSALVEYESFKKMLGDYHSYFSLCGLSPSNYTWVRLVKYISDTSINISTATRFNENYDYYIIPLEIVGVKLTTPLNYKVGTFSHVENGGDTTVVCGFQPKYVALTISSKGRIGVYDERISTTKSVTAIRTPAYNENADIVQVQSDGFVVPSTTVETGTYYYFAIG